MGVQVQPRAGRHGQGLAAAPGAKVQYSLAIVQRKGLDHRLRRGILQFDQTLGIGLGLMNFPRIFGHFQPALQRFDSVADDALLGQCCDRLCGAGFGTVHPQEHRGATPQRFKRCITLFA